jgi:hypothetical protein
MKKEACVDKSYYPGVFQEGPEKPVRIVNVPVKV